jgi:hypothetical protein
MVLPATIVGAVFVTCPDGETTLPPEGDEVAGGGGGEGEVTAGAGVEDVEASDACVGAPACEVCDVSVTWVMSLRCGSSTICEAAVCAPAASYMTRGSKGISPARDWRLRFAAPCFFPAGGFVPRVFMIGPSFTRKAAAFRASKTGNRMKPHGSPQLD